MNKLNALFLSTLFLVSTGAIAAKGGAGDNSQSYTIKCPDAIVAGPYKVAPSDIADGWNYPPQQQPGPNYPLAFFSDYCATNPMRAGCTYRGAPNGSITTGILKDCKNCKVSTPANTFSCDH